MSNIAAVLKSEIIRLSSKAARQYLAPLQRATAAHRRQIAALRRQISTLEKDLKTQRMAAASAAKHHPEPDGVRFVAKGLVSLRRRLGLSAEEFGRLIDVSAQSVYNWEAKKATPRKPQVTAIAALRGLGKREAQARLAVLAVNGRKSA